MVTYLVLVLLHRHRLHPHAVSILEMTLLTAQENKVLYWMQVQVMLAICGLTVQRHKRLPLPQVERIGFRLPTQQIARPPIVLMLLYFHLLRPLSATILQQWNRIAQAYLERLQEERLLT